MAQLCVGNNDVAGFRISIEPLLRRTLVRLVLRASLLLDLTARNYKLNTDLQHFTTVVWGFIREQAGNHAVVDCGSFFITFLFAQKSKDDLKALPITGLLYLKDVLQRMSIITRTCAYNYPMLCSAQQDKAANLL